MHGWPGAWLLRAALLACSSFTWNGELVLSLGQGRRVRDQLGNPQWYLCSVSVAK